MTDNEKAKERATQKWIERHSAGDVLKPNDGAVMCYQEGFVDGYEARTVPADVREAVATCKSLVATMETKADWPTYSPEYRAALRTLIAAVSGDEWHEINGPEDYPALGQRVLTVSDRVDSDENLLYEVAVWSEEDARYADPTWNSIIAYIPIPPYQVSE